MTDHVEDAGVTVTFAPPVAFDIEAVKRAAYRFSDRISVEIKEGSDGIACQLRGIPSFGPLNLSEMAGQFRNEVLDQDLRIKIAEETAPYRNLILSLAFSKTPLSQ